MLLVIQLSFKIFYVIDYIRDSYRCVFTISCLSSRSARDFCSCFERFEYFGGFTYPISSLISFFVASINVLIVWWVFLGNSCFISLFSRHIFFYFYFIGLLLKMSFKFDSKIKTICFVITFIFLKQFCIDSYEIYFLFKS